MLAEGPATFVGQQVSFTGASIEYDPHSGKATARGAIGQPVELYDLDADGNPTRARQTFDELVYDVPTQRISSVKGGAGSFDGEVSGGEIERRNRLYNGDARHGGQ